ncbi:glucokinase [Spinactinospora alkalitolerans]|uniref:Glucokinase n=1 Tax=Spinactinospora alkalitolerans TaxID=687207 RepID=A0A852TVP8_9ACTN|nr:ROK family protein [Spinactinospora alkalitolerans]NYE47781.1 glucokinase [Spinactinospora alkalitolerans]
MNETPPAHRPSESPGTQAIGIDVGGTKVAGGVVDREGEVRGHLVAPTPTTGGPEALLDTIADLVAELRRSGSAPICGVGVGTGGVIDHARGRVASATDLLPGWAGTHVGPRLRRRTGLPVAVDNDGNTHALGELRFGAARTLHDVLFAAVGTGVGGALAIGGALRRGPHHTAGEIGHLPAPGAEGLRCSCGGTGHVEAGAAGPAIAERYRRFGGAPLDLRAVAARAREGDAAAGRAIAEGARILGRSLAGLAAVLDPQAVVVGGGVAEIGEQYWEPLRSAFHDEPHVAAAGTPIVPAQLGSRASIVGAAALAFDDTVDD